MYTVHVEYVIQFFTFLKQVQRREEMIQRLKRQKNELEEQASKQDETVGQQRLTIDQLNVEVSKLRAEVLHLDSGSIAITSQHLKVVIAADFQQVWVERIARGATE